MGFTIFLRTENEIRIKGYTVNALAQEADEGRRSLRKASGRWQTTFDPGISEWDNLSRLNIGMLCKSSFAKTGTMRTETSK